MLGHKGALWLAVRTAGRAAHGSTPERGHNAVLDLAALLTRAGGEIPLRTDEFLGTETWNPGVVTGGHRAERRPRPGGGGHRHAHGRRRRRRCCAGGGRQPEVADVEVRVDLPPVGTPADDPWVATLPGPVLPKPATYFTDASVLVGVVQGAPIVVWGPGTPAVMHARDEYVELAELEQAAAAFADVVARWGRLTVALDATARAARPIHGCIRYSPASCPSSSAPAGAGRRPSSGCSTRRSRPSPRSASPRPASRTSARRGGFTRGAFYSSFRTKDELFAALFARETAANLARAEEQLVGIEEEADPVAAAVERCLSTFRADRTWVLVHTEYALTPPVTPRRPPRSAGTPRSCTAG